MRGWSRSPFLRPVRMPDPLAGGDLIHRAPGRDRIRHLPLDVGRAFLARVLVRRLDQEPWLLPLALTLPHAHEVPAAFQLFAFEGEVEVTFLHPLMGIAFWKPAATIPD